MTVLSLPVNSKSYVEPTQKVTKRELCKFSPHMTEQEIKEQNLIAESGASTHMNSCRNAFGKVEINNIPLEVSEGTHTTERLQRLCFYQL